MTSNQRLPELGPDEMLVQYDGPPARDGKRTFTAFWFDSSKPLYSTEPGRKHICVGHGPGVRAQVFRTDPSPYLAKWRAAGLRVREGSE